MFAHESPRRGFDFVTRKITRTAARIKAGLEKKLVLGNLDAKKDWGFSGDYVRAMWLMLQKDVPGDYVVGTGESHTVKELVEKVFGILGLDWQKYVVTDPKFFRPAPPVDVIANPAKARKVLGWEPKVSFDELVKMMVEADAKNT
jgi:GDPmannose 4,6-dehydratase